MLESFPELLLDIEALVCRERLLLFGYLGCLLIELVIHPGYLLEMLKQKLLEVVSIGFLLF